MEDSMRVFASTKYKSGVNGKVFHERLGLN